MLIKGSSQKKRCFLSVIVGCLFFSLAAFSESKSPEEAESTRLWSGPDGSFLPFKNHEEIEYYLSHARVISQEEISTGSTKPLKLRLEYQGIYTHAIFRTVNVRRQNVKVDGKKYQLFHDSYVYEFAAYKLSKLLGIQNVPPCVRRKIDHREGTLQLWIENAITEQKRREERLRPDAEMSWARQKQMLFLFDALIKNVDRNQGNMLIDGRWKLWFIDHTRSFGNAVEIDNLEKIVWCDRSVWQRLKSLRIGFLKKNLEEELSYKQIQSLLKRRDSLVKYLQARIDKFGEGGVLFSADLETSRVFKKRAFKKGMVADNVSG